MKAAQMRRKPGVEQRIQQLMAENARAAKFTRERAIEWLERVITTPVSELTPDSPLVQSVKETDGGLELRMCDKLIALQTLGKMCNWFSREKFELEIGAADSLKNYLMELRRQTLGAGGMFSMAGERAAPIIELENGGNGEEPPQGANE